MIVQFTTGSVEDRLRSEIQVSILNAGIQPANVVCTLRQLEQEGPINIIEQPAKVDPQEVLILVDHEVMKDAYCELVLFVDSPSLMVTIWAETHEPVHYQIVYVDDIEAVLEGDDENDSAAVIFWGYASKGEPF